MTAEIMISDSSVPQNMTMTLLPSQSENQPKKGAPTAKPIKIIETDWAAMFEEMPNASAVKETPQRPPKIMTGAKANPL